MKPVAIVPPWYGENIPGGAESASRSLAKELLSVGVSVEILTTTIYSFQNSWERNSFKGRSVMEGNVLVRRFPVDPRNIEKFDQINLKFLNGDIVSEEEEQMFFSEMIRSPGLIDYIADHQEEYHCFIFIPYMFSTTVSGVFAASKKAVLMPCFHDEAYAHTSLIKKMVQRVKGIIYLSYPEKDFAQNLFQIPSTLPQEVIGLPVEGIEKINPNPLGFHQKYHIENPYILYAGRKDSGKNADLLRDYFCLFKKRNPSSLKLVYIGDKNRYSQKVWGKDIIDLGFVEGYEKYDAMAGSEFLCQPSIMESFSIVLMESWGMGRPVLVNRECAVTKDFAIRSNGGLYFETYLEFEACLKTFLSNQSLMNDMGENGRQFVLEHFSSNQIAQKYLKFLNNLEV